MEASALGAILIGGQSRRMGTDKAQIEVDGLAMAQWVGRALAAAGLEVVTVGAPDRVAGYPNISDPEGVNGPLAGLLGALGSASHRPVFIAAVDQPLLRAETVRRLVAIRTHDAVVPVAAGFPQVTCALFRPTCLPAIRRLIAVNPDGSIRDLLDYVAVRWVEEDEWSTWEETGDSWRSVNTPEDLAAIRARMEGN
jgi:molybdopterin-guanine dinucleotide biosynthesis protein A